MRDELEEDPLKVQKTAEISEMMKLGKQHCLRNVHVFKEMDLGKNVLKDTGLGIFLQNEEAAEPLLASWKARVAHLHQTLSQPCKIRGVLLFQLLEYLKSVLPQYSHRGFGDPQVEVVHPVLPVHPESGSPHLL